LALSFVIIGESLMRKEEAPMKGYKAALSVLKMTSLPVVLAASAVALLGLLAFLLNASPALGM